MKVIVHTSDGPQMITTPAALMEILPAILFAGEYRFEFVEEEEG